MRVTGGEGADIILETGGAQTLQKSFASVAFGGVIACIGYVSGKEDAPGGNRTNVNLLALQRNVTVKGILNGPRDRFEEMLGFYDGHKIRPPVDRVFGFGEAREALKYLFSGSHFGKVVVKVAP
jgi:NADPH:quinone reductase-like Zn-dependent oxidoreductase